ncbi:hypothetical protein [Streptomyces sedi]|uniref:Uncharacterized protein n=1 Tax=Streptomyces sedi TaxID=555059 RepID=A0A5C4VC06_9ACTN|nr:hypothetical protein [Streptomyces sedi]TNM33423.1 hypothetical protein FH715_03420 [Streptomyces sedi]
MSDEQGRTFRNAWIEGVKRHYPGGTPKPGYIAPWDETPEWERQAAAAVCRQVEDFLAASEGHAIRLNREQKGRFVALCWIAQIHRHFEAPKPGYVADWAELPEWQREVDADIFESIERRTGHGRP